MLTTGVVASTEEQWQPGVSSYCDYVESSAYSTVVGQLYPKLFVSGGVMSDAEAVVATGRRDRESTLWRLQAGLAYSWADLAEGMAIRDRARDECAVYKYQSELFAFLARYDEPDSIAGARAKIEVLSDALPHAQELLEQQQDLLRRHQATVEQVNATSVRLDAMRSEVGSARARVAAFERKHPVLDPKVADVMRSYRGAIERAGSSESRVRSSRRFDLSLKGGYDRLFGVRDGVPLFAMLTLTISPGAVLRQAALEREAQWGRFSWSSAGLEGVHDRVAVLLARLQALLEAQMRRHQDAKALLADLETRYKAVEGMAGDTVRAYRDYLWFDLVRLRGESAYLDAQIAELRGLLAPAEPR